MVVRSFVHDGVAVGEAGHVEGRLGVAQGLRIGLLLSAGASLLGVVEIVAIAVGIVHVNVGVDELVLHLELPPLQQAQIGIVPLLALGFVLKYLEWYLLEALQWLLARWPLMYANSLLKYCSRRNNSGIAEILPGVASGLLVHVPVVGELREGAGAVQVVRELSRGIHIVDLNRLNAVRFVGSVGCAREVALLHAILVLVAESRRVHVYLAVDVGGHATTLCVFILAISAIVG